MIAWNWHESDLFMYRKGYGSLIVLVYCYVELLQVNKVREDLFQFKWSDLDGSKEEKGRPVGFWLKC